MGAIPQDPKDFKVTECIYCFNCVESCPAISVKFAFKKPQGAGTIAPCVKNFIVGKDPDSKETASGIDRRKFLTGAIGGVAAAALVKTDFGKKMPYQRLIRPPAALPEEQFTSVCIRCGECMKVCRTCGLQPTLFEGGIAGLMAPRLIPIAGYCDSACNMCQQVCPTGAIQPFAIEEKSNIILGTAQIDRSACIAWYNEQYCLVCQEHCPYGAIYWKQIEGRLRPMVDEDLCVGCGYCENVCPVKPKSAIKIYSQGEVRVALKPGQKWSQINPRPENSPASKFIDMPPPAEGNR